MGITPLANRPNTPSSSTSSTLRHPKGRLPTAKTEDLSAQVARLSLEVAELKAVRKFADEKIRALTIFGAHQDDVVNVMYHKFSKFRVSTDTDREQIEQEVNAVLEKSDKTVETLAGQFPSLEDVVSRHDGGDGLSISPALAEWIEHSDHIQKKTEEDLLSRKE